MSRAPIAMNGAGTKQNRPFGEASVSAAWGVAWRTRRRAARLVSLHGDAQETSRQ